MRVGEMRVGELRVGEMRLTLFIKCHKDGNFVNKVAGVANSARCALIRKIA